MINSSGLEIKIGEQYNVHALTIRVTGFNTVAGNNMACTKYGEFNIDLLTLKCTIR